MGRILDWRALAVAVSLAALGAAAGAAAPKADHSKFKALQVQFASGQEVTRACLTCHTNAAREVHKTQHWKWEYVNPDTGQTLGKRHVVNNFCTSATSNYGACASCHIGYGMKDEGFDFASEENVDCVVCHDTTGKYRKEAGLAGNVVGQDTEIPPGSGKVVRGLDLKVIAQKVGPTSRASCGACHFFGGGGDAVKHGDLDSSLEAPEKALDVHMDAEGLNFTCATCHQTDGHQVPGSRYAPTARDAGEAHLRGKADAGNPATCQSCHGQSPHRKQAKLNDHTAKVACQACHVPAFARGGIPTKMGWDWSTAGMRAPDGKPLLRRDKEGHVVYNGAKGGFVMAENVVPQYQWFNGTVKYTLPGDKIVDNGRPVAVNRFEGGPDDGKSLIWPVKVFRAKQAWDPVNQSLAVTHLAGNDDSAFWTHLNWQKAVAAGMAAARRPFSGQVGFIATESTWPITHMVAPAREALACDSCHRSGGRLEQVPGVYLPGRGSDHAHWLEFGGWALAGLTLLGSTGHGARRALVALRRNRRSTT